MRRKDLLLSLIPSYPGGCSKELLALSAGYVRKPYSLKNLEKGMEIMDKDLAWITIQEHTIVERKLPLQRTTQIAIKNLGCPALETDTAIYISRDFRETDE